MTSSPDESKPGNDGPPVSPATPTRASGTPRPDFASVTRPFRRLPGGTRISTPSVVVASSTTTPPARPAWYPFAVTTTCHFPAGTSSSAKRPSGASTATASPAPPNHAHRAPRHPHHVPASETGTIGLTGDLERRERLARPPVDRDALDPPGALDDPLDVRGGRGDALLRRAGASHRDPAEELEVVALTGLQAVEEERPVGTGRRRARTEPSRRRLARRPGDDEVALGAPARLPEDDARDRRPREEDDVDRVGARVASSFSGSTISVARPGAFAVNAQSPAGTPFSSKRPSAPLFAAGMSETPPKVICIILPPREERTARDCERRHLGPGDRVALGVLHGPREDETAPERDDRSRARPPGLQGDPAERPLLVVGVLHGEPLVLAGRKARRREGAVGARADRRSRVARHRPRDEARRAVVAGGDEDLRVRHRAAVLVDDPPRERRAARQRDVERLRRPLLEPAPGRESRGRAAARPRERRPRRGAGPAAGSVRRPPSVRRERPSTAVTVSFTRGTTFSVATSSVRPSRTVGGARTSASGARPGPGVTETDLREAVVPGVGDDAPAAGRQVREAERAVGARLDPAGLEAVRLVPHEDARRRLPVALLHAPREGRPRHERDRPALRAPFAFATRAGARPAASTTSSFRSDAAPSNRNVPSAPVVASCGTGPGRTSRRSAPAPSA